MARRRTRSTATAYERSWTRQAMVWLVATKIVVLIVAFDARSLGPFDLVKSQLSRATEWLLLGLIALALIRHGPAVLPRTRLHLAVAAVLAATVASAAFALNTYMALYGDWGRFLGVTFVVDMAVLYLAVAVAFRSATDFIGLFAAIGGAALVSVGYAVVQAAGLDPVRWSADPRARPFGTVGNPDQFAHVLAVVASGGLALAALGSGRRLRVAAAAVTTVALVGLGVAATRAAVLGVGAGALVVAVLWLRIPRASAPRRGRIALAVAGAIALGAVVLALTPLGGRLVATAQGVAVGDRPLIYDGALRMFLDHPLLGVGPDNFGAAYLLYRRPGSEATFNFQRQNSAHDWILQSAATTGTPGLAALLALIAAVGVELWRGAAKGDHTASPLLAAFAAYWAQGLLTVGSISVDWVPHVAAGAVAAAGAAGVAAGQPRRATALQALVFAAALVGFLSVAVALRASYDARAASLATQAGRASEAVAAAEAAARLDPGRSEYWVQLGRARTVAGSEREAGDAYAEATKRDPWNSDYWQHLGASRTRLALAGDRSRGGAEAALAIAAKAPEVDPNTSVPHFHLATVAFNLDDYRTALRESVRAIELYSGDREYDDVAAKAAAKLGDAEARDLLQRALRVMDSGTLRNALTELDQRLAGR